MDKNTSKLSQNNTRLAQQVKGMARKLQKVLKIENIRHHAELNCKNEEVLRAETKCMMLSRPTNNATQ